VKFEKPREKGWKVKKTDLPGPGAHKETEKAYNLTMPHSPVIKFKTGKRIIFAEASAKSK
jgi:hypothetical protein